MKNAFMIMVMMIISFYAKAQDDLCTPDSSIVLNGAYVYPEPYHPRLNPNGGILDTACVGHEYSFVFTAVVPDSLSGVKVDYIEIQENGVLDVPDGIGYSCNPPNCHFESGTIGCFELKGTPTAGNQLTYYDIKMKVNISAAGGLFIINDTLPKFINDSAHYFLPLYAEDCVTATDDIGDMGFELQIKNNPAGAFIDIVLYNELYGDAKAGFSIMDMQGRVVAQYERPIYSGTNTFTLNTGVIPAGIYVLKANIGAHYRIKKLVIR